MSRCSLSFSLSLSLSADCSTEEKLPQEEIDEGLASIRLPNHCDEFKQVIRAFLHADDVRAAK